MKARYKPCPHCGANDVFMTERVRAGGGHAPNLLPELGKWYAAATFDIVVCRSCGLTRLFASQEALNKLGPSQRWKEV